MVIGSSCRAPSRFASRLTAAINRCGRVRWYVANAAGMSVRRLQRLEQDFPLHGPTLAEVEALARVLECRPATLVGWAP